MTSTNQTQWPKGDNKDLLITVANYLTGILNDNASTLDEISIDSLTVATESLQTIISPDSDSLPKPKFSLHDLYNSYIASASASASASQTTSSNDMQERQNKFLQFVDMLSKRNFFKNCTEGSPEYMERLENARLQYNKRFPDKCINSLQDLITQPHTSKNQNQNNSNPQPMDTDNDKTADQLKKEGNMLLTNGKFDQAIEKYNQAIGKDPNNAVFYSNLAAAYTYKKEYKMAAEYAEKAVAINPKYVKAYVRLGVARFEMGQFSSAFDAYQNALDRTPPSNKNWESYNDKVELCKQKMEQQSSGGSGTGTNSNSGQGLPDMSQFANMFGGGGGGGGGQPDFNSLLSGLGGADGLQNLMKNPMMQKMAQQMMQDPNAMKNMTNMMNNMGGGAGGAGDAGAAGDAPGNAPGADDELRRVMMDAMSNPEKAKRVFSRAMQDPEAQQLMVDPVVKSLFERLKNSDYSALIELGQKPEALAKVKILVKKYYKLDT